MSPQSGAMNYTVVSLAERRDLTAEQNRIGGEAWPEFMLHDPVAITNWMELVDVFGEYQLLIMEGEEILAVANSAPLHFSQAFENLPEEGVDWGVRKAISDHHGSITPNTLMGVQVVVGKAHLGKGLSAVATREMLRLAKDKGVGSLIVPLRPSDKHRYPLISMDEYVLWENGRGLPFDSWLRVQVRAGGRIVGVCSKSMYIPGTVREWEEWTGQRFPGTGRYIIPGALNPVEIDVENDIGTYVEPNIWVVHDPGSP